MTRGTTRVVVSVALVACLLVTGVTAAVAGPAAAQSSDVLEDDQEESDDEPDGPHSSVFDVDEDVRVTSVDYDEQNKTLEVGLHNRGDTRETVYLAEIMEAGAESWGFVTLDLRAGEETVVDLDGIQDRGGGEAVMIASQTSIDNERVHWISTGEAEEDTVVTLSHGVLIGVLTLGLVTPLMAWRRYNKPGKAPEDGMTDSSSGWFR